MEKDTLARNRERYKADIAKYDICKMVKNLRCSGGLLG